MLSAAPAPVDGPAWPSGKPSSSATAGVRLGPWEDGYLELGIGWAAALSQDVLPGLGPLQWLGEASSSRMSSGEQVVRRASFDVAATGPAGSAACRLWWGIGAVSAEGSAAEATATESTAWDGVRVWSGSGTAASAGAAVEWPLGNGWVAGFEAGVADGQWSGPLEERTTTTWSHSDMTLESFGQGWASAGRQWGYGLWRVGRFWFSGKAAVGLGWANERQWGEHRTYPGEERVTFGDGSTLTSAGTRGEENRFSARWEGLVFPFEARWQPTPYLAVIASAAGWWGASTEHAGTHLHAYFDGQLVGEQQVVSMDSHRPSRGWTWRLGAMVFVDGAACWRLEAGPGGRLSMAFEALT